MLPCQRGLFPLPEDEHYPHSAYFRPLLTPDQAARIAAPPPDAAPWPTSAAPFRSGPNELRELFGELVNAPPERVALVPSVSYGVAIAAQNLPLGRGSNVVIPGEEFPSNFHAWMERSARARADLRFRDRPQDAQAHGGAWNRRPRQPTRATAASLARPETSNQPNQHPTENACYG